MQDFWQLTLIEQEALWLSLQVAFWCVLISVPLGILVSFLLVRVEFPGKLLFETLIHLPLVLPPVATGYALLILFGKKGILGMWLFDWFGLRFTFSWKGAVLASIVVSFPLLVRAIRISLENVDFRLEQVARTLGANPLRVFFTITLPLMVPGIVSGMMLAFARSLGEFGATITFVSNIQGETMTLPLALFSLLQQPDSESAAIRLLILSIALSLIALFASEKINQWLNQKDDTPVPQHKDS